MTSLVSRVPATYVCLRVYRTYDKEREGQRERERERGNPIISHTNEHSKALKIHYKSKCFGEVSAIRYNSYLQLVRNSHTCVYILLYIR